MNNFTDRIGDGAKYPEDQKTRRKEIEAERDKMVKDIDTTKAAVNSKNYAGDF